MIHASAFWHAYRQYQLYLFVFVAGVFVGLLIEGIMVRLTAEKLLTAMLVTHG